MPDDPTHTDAAGTDATVRIALRRRSPGHDSLGRRVWRHEVSERSVPAHRLAVVICDMWDRHWSRGATSRVNELAPKIDAWCRSLRELGVLIVHAPSDTMDAYLESPARQRIRGRALAPEPKLALPPPMPFSLGRGGTDTDDADEPDTAVWTRQHPAIHIDEERDLITDEGRELAPYLAEDGRDVILMAGVHTNLCVLRRSFGLLALAAHGFAPVLVADLTDAMYDPAEPPYVDHQVGTDLVLGYVEAFVAPTTRSPDLAVIRRRGDPTAR